MQKFKYLSKLKELYEKNINIIQYLKSLSDSEINSIEDILISYDFQAGSYLKGFSKNRNFKNSYCGSLAKIINNIKYFDSIMEIGIGEATTLCPLLQNLDKKPSEIYGFDISWSRLKFADALLKDFNFKNITLFTANLFEIPLKDSSIDIVYTSHSIEPNGGREEEALIELYRVTRKYLILLEPAYEFASEEARKRMKFHGYVTNLYQTAKKLGYKIIEHRLFDYSSNQLNPTGLMIIEKTANEVNSSHLVCPITFGELIEYNENFLFTKDNFLVYPVLEKIPCLLKENSILASHLLTDYKEFKKRNNVFY